MGRGDALRAAPASSTIASSVTSSESAAPITLAAASRLNIWCTTPSDNSSCAIIDGTLGTFVSVPGALTTHVADLGTNRLVFFTSALRFSYATIVDAPPSGPTAVVGTARVFDAQLLWSSLKASTHAVAVGRTTTGTCALAAVALSSGIATNTLSVAGPNAACVADVVPPMVALRAVTVGTEQQPTVVAGIGGSGTRLTSLYSGTLTLKSTAALTPLILASTPSGRLVNSTFLAASVSWLDPGKSRVLVFHVGEPASTSPTAREPTLIAERLLGCQPDGLQFSLDRVDDRLTIGAVASSRPPPPAARTARSAASRRIRGLRRGSSCSRKTRAAPSPTRSTASHRSSDQAFGVTLARTTLSTGVAVVRVMPFEPVPGPGFAIAREVRVRGVCRTWTRGVAGLFLGEADVGMYVGAVVTSAPFPPSATSAATQAKEIPTAAPSDIGFVNGTCGTPLMANPTQLRGGSVLLFTVDPDPARAGTIVNAIFWSYATASDKASEQASGATHFTAASAQLAPRWSELQIGGVVEWCSPAGTPHKATLVTRANPGIATTLRILSVDFSAAAVSAQGATQQIVATPLANETDIDSVVFVDQPAVSALTLILRRSSLVAPPEGETIVLVIDTNFASIRSRVVIPGTLFRWFVPAFDPDTVIVVSSTVVANQPTRTRLFSLAAVDAARAATTATVALPGVATTAFASDPVVVLDAVADDDAAFVLFGSFPAATFVAYTRPAQDRAASVAGRFHVATSSPPHQPPARRNTVVSSPATTGATAAAAATAASPAARTVVFTTPSAAVVFLGLASAVSSSSASPWLVLEGRPYVFTIPAANPRLLLATAQVTDTTARLAVIDCAPKTARRLAAQQTVRGDLHNGRGMIDTEVRTSGAWTGGTHARWFVVPTYDAGLPPRATALVVNISVDPSSTTPAAVAIRSAPPPPPPPAADGERMHIAPTAENGLLVMAWWRESYTLNLFALPPTTNPTATLLSADGNFTYARQFIALLPSPADVLTDDAASRRRTFVVQQQFGSAFVAVDMRRGLLQPVAAPSTAATSVEVLDRLGGSTLTLIGSRATQFWVFDSTDTQLWAGFNGTVLATLRATQGKRILLLVLSRLEIGLAPGQLAVALSHLTIFDATTGALLATLPNAWRSAKLVVVPVPGLPENGRFVLLCGVPVAATEAGFYALLDRDTGMLTNATRAYNVSVRPFLDRVGDDAVPLSATATSGKYRQHHRGHAGPAARGLGNATGAVRATQRVLPGMKLPVGPGIPRRRRDHRRHHCGLRNSDHKRRSRVAANDDGAGRVAVTPASPPERAAASVRGKHGDPCVALLRACPLGCRPAMSCVLAYSGSPRVSSS
ncbi:MAG: hypothetical protein U5N85_20405 [Arcicella sp.]|nr:hypothetical protein [Arcicella sp.]